MMTRPPNRFAKLQLKVERIVVDMFGGKSGRVVVWWGSESVMFSMETESTTDFLWYDDPDENIVSGVWSRQLQGLSS